MSYLVIRGYISGYVDSNVRIKRYADLDQARHDIEVGGNADVSIVEIIESYKPVTKLVLDIPCR